ncbi:hypothetical protein DFH06DRAFT_1467465 [Mycena polygramma]|nr:hypothetical protein DFH06DRAFT_1467465 [Mycena polygramma]
MHAMPIYVPPSDCADLEWFLGLSISYHFESAGQRRTQCSLWALWSNWHGKSDRRHAEVRGGLPRDRSSEHEGYLGSFSGPAYVYCTSNTPTYDSFSPFDPAAPPSPPPSPPLDARARRGEMPIDSPSALKACRRSGRRVPPSKSRPDTVDARRPYCAAPEASSSPDAAFDRVLDLYARRGVDVHAPTHARLSRRPLLSVTTPVVKWPLDARGFRSAWTGRHRLLPLGEDRQRDTLRLWEMQQPRDVKAYRVRRRVPLLAPAYLPFAYERARVLLLRRRSGPLAARRTVFPFVRTAKFPPFFVLALLDLLLSPPLLNYRPLPQFNAAVYQYTTTLVFLLILRLAVPYLQRVGLTPRILHFSSVHV